MPLKIVHCADLHIGVSLSHLPYELALKRTEEIREGFLDIINFCKEKSADALLICGDLFDNSSPTCDDCDFVKNALMSLSDTDIFIISGNHDYMCANSPFIREGFFPENVHIFPCFEHSFDIPEKNAVFWGKSYNSSVIEPSFENVKFDSEKINIMCLHGDTAAGSDYNIVSSEVLRKLNCNYAAFGHIHNGEVFETGNTKCAYSGTNEGHSFSDDGFTGFIYACITKDETIVTPVSFSKRHYQNISLDVSGQKEEEIIEAAKAKLNTTDFFRLSLVGSSFLNDAVNIASIKKELSKYACYIDVYDKTSPEYDFDEIENEDSLRGEFLRALRLISKSEEDFILSGKIGLDALSGKLPSLGGHIC